MPKQDLHDTISIAGNINGVNQSISSDSKGYSSGCAGAIGSFSGDMFLEGSIDGVNYVGLTAKTNTGIHHEIGSTNNANQVIFFGCSGLISVRIRSTSWLSGTASVTITLSTGAPRVV